MAFQNEYISPEDVEKYALAEIDKHYIAGGTNARSWTIDRDRDIYLRSVARGREDTYYMSTWTFYWKGCLIPLEIHNISTARLDGGARHGHKKLAAMHLPAGLQVDKQEIVEVLKEALLAYKDGGVFATASSYTLTLEV